MSTLHKPPCGDKVEAGHLEGFPRDGIHQHCARLAAFCRSRGVSARDAAELIEDKAGASGLRRPLQPNEATDAVESVYGGKMRKRKGRLKRLTHVPPSFSGTWPNDMPLPLEQAEPETIRKALAASEPWPLEEVWEDSPLKVDEMRPEQILGMLFASFDLTVAGSVRNFAVKTMSEWSESGEMGEQVVPNPNAKLAGRTKKGKLSAHCRDAVGSRYYLVIEFDDPDLGSDKQAGLLRFLRDQAEAELRMIVHSGGKSLHGWFSASPDESLNWKFMRLGCRLGADPRMWLPEQLARTPNAVRSKNGAVQKTFYFNP